MGSQWNGAVNEMNFAQSLVKGSEFVLDWSPVNIIDTGRNGVDDARADCANWCSPRNMGAGKIPTTSTGNELVDAFFCLKTPGESDGCTQELPDGTQCPRYDTMCGSSDSIGSQSSEPKAPEAGHWFDFLQLFKDMGVSMSGVRGFAQNVANYQPIGTMCEWEGGQGSKMERNNHCLPSGSGAGDACCHDPCKLASQWNGAVNEMNFAQSLVKGSEFVLDWSPVNIIDTGRNGVDDARQDCANWCNPRDMGAGAIPTTSTGNSLVD